VNATGTPNFLRAVIAQMKPQELLTSVRSGVRRPCRGSVVAAGPAVSLTCAHWLAAHTASKHAVLGLAKSAAVEVAMEGIRVNLRVPGMTDTP